MRPDSSFCRHNVVHTILMPRRIPSVRVAAANSGGLGLLARLEGELLRLRRQLARRSGRGLGRALPDLGSVHESLPIRSLRRRIEELEALIPVHLGQSNKGLYEVGKGLRGPFSGRPRVPHHRLLGLSERIVDQEAEERRAALMAQILRANLELKRRTRIRRSGA
jgi:hypothetical protein